MTASAAVSVVTDDVTCLTYMYVCCFFLYLVDFLVLLAGFWYNCVYDGDCRVFVVPLLGCMYVMVTVGFL